jgi:hypothetical protein
VRERERERGERGSDGSERVREFEILGELEIQKEGKRARERERECV